MSRARSPFCLLAFLAGGVFLHGACLAQTITVTMAQDAVDFGGAQTVADLPGPDGKVSMNEATLASDNTPGVQTIAFNVPQSEWEYQWLYPGRAVIFAFGGVRTFQPVVIDATTQTAFTGDTNPDGGEVVLWSGAYFIDNVGGAVLGLDHTQFQITGGSANRIQGNSACGIEIYESSSNLIGGTNPGEGNIGGHTLQIIQSHNNVIVGNTLDRVRFVRWSGSVLSTNNRIGGPTAAERNRIVGTGTWNSQGSAGGFAIEVFDSSGTIIENNQIGTTPDGMSVGHLACLSGIYFNGEHHNTIIRNNTIAGILSEQRPPHTSWYRLGYAVVVGGTGGGVTITGNKFGFNANGEPLLGSTNAILTVNNGASTVQNVVIGGTGPGEANEIAGQLGDAIVVNNAFSGVRISGNSIHDNAGLGIDLVTSEFLYGVTPNDALDGDAGGNGLQNFPVLASAESGGSGTTIQGGLNSLANQAFTIEFFASPACDSSGHGQGRMYLGATNVTTDGAGNAAFNANVPIAATPGWVVTATAAQTSTGNTSEFSACVPVTGGCPADFNGDGFVNGDDYDAFAEAFDVADPSADFNADGFVNGDDYDAFAEAFEGGC